LEEGREFVGVWFEFRGLARFGGFGEAVYAGCKAAIITFSKTVAREHGRHNIQVNVVGPGITSTSLLHSVAETQYFSNKTSEVSRMSIANEIALIIRHPCLPECRQRLPKSELRLFERYWA
jgi:NAD(P)-dependent dehydrogenase (short-subunit alcohol dehydrogenase family)